MRYSWRKFVAAALLVGAVAVLVVAPPVLAQVATVSSAFESGNLVFRDVSRNIIATFDGTNRKITIPSGASLEVPEAALQTYELGPSHIRNAAFSAGLVATEAAGTFNWTLGTNTIVLSGEVTDNETETSVAWVQFRLPAEYVSAGDVTVRFRSELLKTGSPTNNGSTLDLSCYEQADGAVGADIVATAAATFAALDTFYNKDFSITATDLVAGDILNCKITTAVIDSEAGAGTITFTSDPPKVLIDVLG